MAKKTPPRDDTGKFVKSEDNKDEEINYKEDLQNKSFSEVASEPTEEGTEKVEEVEVKEEVKEVEEKFDPKKFKEEVASEISTKVSQDTTAKIVEALKGKDTTNKEVNIYQKMASDFMAKERAAGREPTWESAFAFLAENSTKLAVENIKKEQQEQAKKYEDQKRQYAETEKARTQAFNKYLDEQLEDLHKSGRVPKEDKELRKALFQTMMDVNTARVKQGQQPIYSIKEIYYEHFKAPNREVAGADAPVSAGLRSSGHSVDDSQEYSYGDIKKKSFTDLLMGK